MIHTQTIFASALESLQKYVALLNKKAAKLSVHPIVLAVKPAPPWYLISIAGGPAWVDNPNDPRVTGEIGERVEVTISGESPKYNGWEFLAKLSPVELPDGGQKNLLLAIPGWAEGDLSPYITDVGRCDHCNTVRRRNDTFLVKHTSGTIRVVGRQCIKDFLGHASPKQLLDLAAMMTNLPGVINDLDDHERAVMGSRETSVSLIPWLAVSSMAYRLDGYVSRATAAEQGRMATATLVSQYFHMKHGDVKWKERYKPDQQAFSEAEFTRAWMLQKDPQSGSYYANLRTIAEAGHVTSNGQGFATSAIVSYRKEMDDRGSAVRPKSHYVGVVGEKHTFRAELTGTSYIPSQFGTKCLHRFRMEDGSLVVWFASNTAAWQEKKGTYEFTAMVNKHDEYRGQKQTVIQRPKFTLVPAAEPSTAT